MSEENATTQQQQPETTTQVNEQTLKYLDFIQIAAIYALVCFASIYDFAKENSGPLKPGVETVEGTVKTVIGPVYEKFHDIPFELLRFIDRKVEEYVTEIEHYVPPLVKEASSQAFTAAQKAPEVARAVASEVHRAGVVETATEIVKTVYTKCEPTAKEIYEKYEPVAEHYAVSAWHSLNKLPVFPQVAEIVVPTAAYWSQKYNQVVCDTAEKGYTVACYLPLVPVDRIAKVFGNEDGETETTTEPLVLTEEKVAAAQ